MQISTNTPRDLLRRALIGSVLAVGLLGCTRRSTDPRHEELRRELAELVAEEERAMRRIDLTALDAEATTDTVAPGLVHYALRFAEGPWVVHVLDVDLRACWSAVAVKAGGGAVGRARTTDLLETLFDGDSTWRRGDRTPVVAGVNADFFRFNPPGVPQTAHIQGGRVIAGPSRRPVLTIDGGGSPSIAVLEDSGHVVIAGDTLPLSAWNRAAPDGLALFDENWRAATDSATGAVELIVTARSAAEGRAGQPRRRRGRGLLEGIALGIDTLPAGVGAREGHVVLVAGAGAPSSLRARLLATRPGVDSVHVQRWITQRMGPGTDDTTQSGRSGESVEFPAMPSEAVGGFPVLVRRDRIAPNLDSAGGRGFGPVRHPRTAVGISGMGTHLLLVTVDGRQPGYSVGMTLPELARLMLDLGATVALNLDGGGSTTMALGTKDGMTRILNQPSDTSGERPVSNALAVVPVCRESPHDRSGIPERAP